MLITRDTFALQTLTNSELLLTKAREIMASLKPRRYNYTRDEVAQFEANASSLYASFFSPFEDLLKGANLIISSDDELSLLPFEILVKPSEDSLFDDFRDLNYLIREHAVTYTNTATLWAFHKDKSDQPVAGHTVISFAPFYEPGRKGIPFSAVYGEPLPRLPGTLEESDQISRLFNSRVFKKKKATEAQFRKQYQDASVLHLAMHTIIDNDEPLNSFLVFYPDQKEREDGRLSGGEVMNLDIRADLVVLSACNSGSGNVRAGEGLLGLSRSFIQSGSSSLVLNLWTMDDTQGKDIIKEFYNFINQGVSVSKALQLAKLNHLNSSRSLQAHPHYWAGLVVQGTDLIPTTKPARPYHLLYLLLLIPMFWLIWQAIKKLGPKGNGSQSGNL